MKFLKLWPPVGTQNVFLNKMGGRQIFGVGNRIADAWVVGVSALIELCPPYERFGTLCSSHPCSVGVT